MKKTFVKYIKPYVELHFDRKTGIAWIEDHSAGIGHSAHPNISVTGSIRGMKALGYWQKDDRVVRSHGFYYNIDHCVISTEYDRIASQYCKCGGNHAK